MSDGRRRRRTKQVRRDVRRRQKRCQDTDSLSADPALQALSACSPLDMLVLVSMLIQRTRPGPFEWLRSSRGEKLPRLEVAVARLIADPSPETVAMLGAFAELLVDDEILQTQCRQGVAASSEPLPRWIAELARLEVHSAARVAHVLGDVDGIMVGARLAGGDELTCVVYVNHNMLSEVIDAVVTQRPIGQIIAELSSGNRDPDTRIVEMSLADAGAWIQHGLDQPMIAPETDGWPGLKPLVQWLVGHLPDGGMAYHPPDWEDRHTMELCAEFFASAQGAQFDDYQHQDLLLALLETGNGDPLRWGVARVVQALDGPGPYGERLSVATVLDAPDLLREFIPFAHARSGIRDELTAQALVVIDELAAVYRQEVLARVEWSA